MVLIFVCRVHESCSSYGDRVCSDGIRWLLCEAHLYSHQQHHRRRHLGIFFLFLQFISDRLYVNGVIQQLVGVASILVRTHHASPVVGLYNGVLSCVKKKGLYV